MSADARELFEAYTQDPEVTRFLCWRPHEKVEDCERFIASCSGEIARGSDLEVRVVAPGRTAVSVAWRAQGDVPRQRTLEVVADNATGLIPRIETTTTYWVTTPDGARSERYTITPVDPMLVADLVVELRAPAYVGRAVERYQTDVPPLEIEEGTEKIGRAHV